MSYVVKEEYVIFLLVILMLLVIFNLTFCHVESERLNRLRKGNLGPL